MLHCGPVTPKKDCRVAATDTAAAIYSQYTAQLLMKSGDQRLRGLVVYSGKIDRPTRATKDNLSYRLQRLSRALVDFTRL